MIGYVYITTNLITGRYYIGQHHATVFEPERYLGSGKAILMAIKKYGKENFSCELLATADTQEELDSLEKHYIKEYCATDRNVGYNIQAGGQSNLFITRRGYKQIDGEWHSILVASVFEKEAAEADGWYFPIDSAEQQELYYKAIETREIKKQYKQQHRDRTRAAGMKAYFKNWENNKEKKHKWSKENREHLTEYAREYREAHKEERKAYSKEYYKKNKEKLLENNRRYLKKKKAEKSK